MKIFICYRRIESFGHALALSNLLRTHFGRETIFLDIDAIDPGEDFAEAIERAIEGCDAVIAVIGKDWLTASDESGRRLDHPEDFVRLELTAALKRNIRIIPALVQGASMPSSQDLPLALAPMARRHAITISDSHFESNVGDLIRSLEKIVKSKNIASPTQNPIPASAISPLPRYVSYRDQRLKLIPLWGGTLAVLSAVAPLFTEPPNSLIPAWAPEIISKNFSNYSAEALVTVLFAFIATAFSYTCTIVADKLFTLPLSASEHFKVFAVNFLFFSLGFVLFFGLDLWLPGMAFAVVAAGTLAPILD